MNAPEKITSAEPINAAHEVLMKAADAMCTQQIASEIHGRPRPTKPQIKAVEKWLKEVHYRGMLTSQPGRGGVALYSLTTPVCDLVQTRGESQTAAPAERVLTPEAQDDRDDFEAQYGDNGNCSCHVSAPCGSCMHPGNPMQQENNDACHDGCAGEQCKVERDSLPVDSQREEFTLLGLIADIRAAAGDPDGRLMQDELVQHIAAIVKERDDLRERLDAQIKQWQADTGRLVADLRAAMEARSHAINEADRLRTELTIERQARKALQEQGNATDVTAAAVGYLVRVPKRPPMIRRKPEAARLAAMGAVRAGAARAEVLAVVPVGTARRGAEWQSTEAQK